jgi:hypothetical protein
VEEEHPLEVVEVLEVAQRPDHATAAKAQQAEHCNIHFSRNVKIWTPWISLNFVRYNKL